MNGFGSVSGRRAACVRRTRMPPERREAEEGLERRCVSGAVTVMAGREAPCPCDDCACACGLMRNAPEAMNAVNNAPAIPLRLELPSAGDKSFPLAAMRLIAPSHTVRNSPGFPMYAAGCGARRIRARRHRVHEHRGRAAIPRKEI